MAPEVLNSTGKAYTNKADLWSIGVIFYQMLFGKTPFGAKNYQDLKIKVMRLSGKNLRFPAEVRVSGACKSLLIGLIQYNPDHRLEWNAFFNHALFELHKKDSTDALRSSVIRRQNQDQTRQEFTHNQSHAHHGEFTLKNPSDMRQAPIRATNIAEAQEGGKPDKLFEEISQAQRAEDRVKEIKARYIHEKKKIILIMYTARKLRNLAKQKQRLPELAAKLMLSACVLLQKGMVLNLATIGSLRKSRNLFKMKGFADFAQTERAKFVGDFELDQKVYDQFHKQMNEKFSEEVACAFLRKERAKFAKMTLSSVEFVNNILLTHFVFFRDRLGKLGLNPELEVEYSLALLNFYYSIQTESLFPFRRNKKRFLWMEFEKKVTDRHSAKEQLLQIKIHKPF